MDGSGIIQIVTEGITTAPYGLAISYDGKLITDAQMFKIRAWKVS